MEIAVRKLHPLFAAEVTGVDLVAPLDDDLFAQIRDAFNEHAVLVFPDQKLDDEQQIAFGLRFGPLETSVRKDRKRRVTRPEISEIANVDEHGRLVDASLAGHGPTALDGRVL
jgi:alpha-ketoglutarate-dependent 2,4-dichlorophenoxyacetate dioxygenase